MKVGDYVRTKYGITQYKEYETTNGKLLCMPIHDMTQGFFANAQDIIKSSPNIIDLIQEGDYVNGYKVDFVQNNEVIFNHNHPRQLNIMAKDIKSVVTKEIFEQMEYRVNKND